MEKLVNDILLTTEFTDEDIEYSVKRHGEIFNSEFGFSKESHGPVAGMIREFGATWNPEKDFMLVARKNGNFIGTITFMGGENGNGRLRFLFVEPSERGFGTGKLIVTTALQWAKDWGYTHLHLSTFDVLKTARAMYTKLGFVKTSEEPADYVVPGIVEEIWEIDI